MSYETRSGNTASIHNSPGARFRPPPGGAVAHGRRSAHPARGFAVDPVGPATEALLRKANFEVIVDRPAPALTD